MTRIPNLITRNGVYWTKVQIPADVRAAYGKTWDGGSLKTREPNTAMERHGPLVAKIKRKIDALRLGRATGSAVAEIDRPDIWSPDDAFAAIGRWAKATTDRAYLETFHSMAPSRAPFGDEAMAHAAMMHAFQEKRWGDVADLDSMLVEALTGEGIEVKLGDPALSRLRGWFGEALHRVEKHREAFGRDDFSGWTLDGPAAPQGATVAAPVAATVSSLPGASTPVSGVLESYLKVGQLAAKDESEIRGYVRRLIEHLGDIPIGTVTTPMLDTFLVSLRQFPFTRRPEIVRLPFDVIIERFGDDEDMPRLANKTIRTKWFGSYNRLFAFALSRDLIIKNPVAAAMPKKRDDADREREAWDADQIKAMFAKPLFAGASDLRGYREKAGELIAHDAKFWLPIIALWSGMRLDELGAARVDELRREDGIWLFDLTKRPTKGYRRVKNAQSQRIVPVHQKLIELGLIHYAQAQAEWLFPDLPHDERDDGATTSQISKWFGLWRRNNGFHDPARMQDHHSFRHAFIRACRQAEIAEEHRDLLTGHAGSANQQTSRAYGRGGMLKLLATSMAKVNFPTFPTKSIRSYPGPRPESRGEA